ncbi:MAG TPA: hypothetical protein VFG69_12300 [Nannocystaceae bacterium]|nr:hypothetical protein [Nannocystaceae bacterium]
MSTSATWMCTACGYLEVPADMAWSARDPLRSEGGADPREAPCRHCGAREWADLGDATTIAALRHVDAAEAPTRVSASMRALRRLWAVTRGVSGLAIGAALVVGLLTSTLAQGGLLILLYPGIVALVIVVVATVVDAFRDVRDARAAPMPARWRLALPEARTPLATVTGLARADGPLLRAPLTDRACLAYELGIRIDDDPGAPEATWLLLEQRSTAFVIREHRFPPDTVRLDLERTRVEPSALDEDRVGAIMRARGFLATDTSLAVFESIVPEGAWLDVRPAALRTGPSARRLELPRVRVAARAPALPAAVGDRA